jgi:crotonobetainyl-CoA:carnitine CoA-transferase CaiB-like acyl-CoA transferase
MSATHDAPYRGLRVLDFGQGIASPYCAMLLGVYGAEVIKVEPPEGDWSRYLGTTYGSHTALSAVYNRGKHSLCLDLKHDEGIRIARRLAGDCDVFIEGFRPGVAARLGIGYEDLARDNPGLIYLSVSGFGQVGPYSKRPGSDSVAQAFSGLVSVNVGNDKTPHRVGTTISDVATGVYAFQAIAAALFARATVGTGRWIDISLTQSTAALLGHKVAEHVLEGDVFLTQSSETWLGRLHAANIIAERILSPGDWLRNVHVEATKSAVCQDTPGVGLVYAPRTPGFMGLSEDKLRPAPDVGADSRAVLLDAGFDGDAIDNFISVGVVRTSVR